MNTIKRYREIIVYLFFGALTVLLNCVLYVLFNHFFGYEFANGIGNALANFICILFAYVTNRTAVFCSKSSGISAIREIVCFIV
ncbi:GtrA family protein [Lactococcus lactis]|uniref:GtrA family protein n=1 Tax=Lactococcus TaxID=1357 RepID=UPI0021D10119|nr:MULTISPECIES: GtrA family protein [Lactococcus]MDH5115059.1 GtrA family protein [Lactococcus lactis]UXV59869.1 GtrA family protein [Lactococcus cremoris]